MLLNRWKWWGILSEHNGTLWTGCWLLDVPGTNEHPPQYPRCRSDWWHSVCSRRQWWQFKFKQHWKVWSWNKQMVFCRLHEHKKKQCRSCSGSCFVALKDLDPSLLSIVVHSLFRAVFSWMCVRSNLYVYGFALVLHHYAKGLAWKTCATLSSDQRWTKTN